MTTSWIRCAPIVVLLLMGLQEPAQAKEYVTHFVHANGISVAYQDIGDRSDPAVVLIMGLSGQLISWPQKFIDGLTDAGFRVIRFDNRDAGLSEKLYERGEPSFTWAAIKRPERNPARRCAHPCTPGKTWRECPGARGAGTWRERRALWRVGWRSYRDG